MCRKKAQKHPACITRTREKTGKTGDETQSVYISDNTTEERKRLTMDFITKNWQYIFSNATSKAVEIAQKTGFFYDVEDFRQEILAFLAMRAYRYDHRKAKPVTFIEVCMQSAKKNIIRNIYRKKKRFVYDAEPLEGMQASFYEDNSFKEDITDYINGLPFPQQDICRDFFLMGINTRTIGKKFQIPKENIMPIIRQAMKPFAESIGIRTQESDGSTDGAATAAEGDQDTPKVEKVLPDPDFTTDPGGSSTEM